MSKRIRILVSFDNKDNWIAMGGSDFPTDKKMKENIFIEGLNDGEHYCFIEADIPDHIEPVIEGTVK